MSTSGRHHIPFPKTWLTVNTPLKQSKPANVAPSSPAESVVPAHGFLSNIDSPPAIAPRHRSGSSVSSVGSSSSASSAAFTSSANEPAAPPFAKQTLPAFLSLNTKHAAPPTSAQAMKEGEKHGYLSNRN